MLIITCLICTDILNAESDVYATKCGHLFHYLCLLTWIQSHPNCPQCRSVVNQKDVFKIYQVSAVVEDEVNEDLGALRKEIENLRIQGAAKATSIAVLKRNEKKLKNDIMNQKRRINAFAKREEKRKKILAKAQEEAVFYRNESKEKWIAQAEVYQLKDKIDQYQNIDYILETAEKEAKEFLKNETHMKSLAIMAMSLKQALSESERKRKHVKNQLSKIKSQRYQMQEQGETPEKKRKSHSKHKHSKKNRKSDSDERQIDVMMVPGSSSKSRSSSSSSSSSASGGSIDVSEESNSTGLNLKSNSVPYQDKAVLLERLRKLYQPKRKNFSIFPGSSVDPQPSGSGVVARHDISDTEDEEEEEEERVTKRCKTSRKMTAKKFKGLGPLSKKE